MKSKKEAALVKKLKHLWSTPAYSGTGGLTFKGSDHQHFKSAIANEDHLEIVKSKIHFVFHLNCS